MVADATGRSLRGDPRGSASKPLIRTLQGLRTTFNGSTPTSAFCNHVRKPPADIRPSKRSNRCAAQEKTVRYAGALITEPRAMLLRPQKAARDKSNPASQDSPEHNP